MTRPDTCGLKRGLKSPNPVFPVRQSGLIALLLAASAALVSCGGSSGSSTAPVATVPPVVVVDPLTPATPSDLDKVAGLYGIEPGGIGGDAAGDGGAAGAAGDGSPLKGAVVTLTDAKGSFVSGTTDSKGQYLLRYKTANFTAPLVLRVIDAGGNVLSSVTDETAATGKVIRASINPLTDKIASDVIPASVAGTDKVFTGAAVDVTKLAVAKADLVTSVKDALGVAGIADVSKFDPVKSVYVYDGTGVDAVIESISHTRNGTTGATELQAKLASVSNKPDGTFTPTLITASTPLATTQVSVASNPTLTFSKLKVFTDGLNACFAKSVVDRRADAACGNGDGTNIIFTPDYKHNSKNFGEDFRTLVSEADESVVQGSTFSNPNILYFVRTTGATVDDRAVVEFTINQPRTGPLAGNISTPIQYTKIMVFKRDDTLTRSGAGNWIAHGNQRAFDWSVDARYIHRLQSNPAKQANASGGDPSEVTSGVRLRFSPTVFNATTRTFVSANVYAVRFTGPGLPAAGVVLAPFTNSTSNLRVLNKTGVIPSPGTVANIVQNDFRMGGAALATGAPIDPAVWGSNRPYRADASSGTDFSSLQMGTLYKAEIYVNGSSAPIVETTRLVAGIQAPSAVAKIPLHDLSANLALITPPQSSANTVTVQWARVPGAVRIESAYAYFFSGSNFVNPSTNLSDAFSVTPTSTSAVISNGTLGFPASAITDYREVGITGFSARSEFLNILGRTP